MSHVDTQPVEETTPKSKKKLLVAVVLVLVMAAAAYWYFMVRPAEADEAPKPGEVVQLEPIQINLTGGHYLRVGIALQGVEGAHEIEGSKALDATIELFSGRSMQDLTRKPFRNKLKHKLLEQLEERYHGEVIEVYFTDFVTQ